MTDYTDQQQLLELRKLVKAQEQTNRLLELILEELQVSN